MSASIFRFAPSPNGPLHLGHAYSALLNQRFATRTGGRLLLRIEDIDTARCTPEFEAAIFRDLEWLDIDWERPVRRQSEHFELYRSHLQKLIDDDLVYPAFMSRAEFRAHIVDAETSGENWQRDPDGVPLYPPVDRALSQRVRASRIDAGAPFAWRLDMAKAVERAGGLSWSERSGGDLESEAMVKARPQDWGDVILARRDTPTSYHLSVVVDDALQGITQVVRGQDLYAATGVQRVLQVLLGFEAPDYHHHRLVLGTDGRKLSKSAGDTGIATFRERGETPGSIRRLVDPQ